MYSCLTLNGKEYVSFQQLTKWTNIKASHAGAGKVGTCYKDFTPFSVEELRRHVGLYVWNGLSPSPHVEMKFKSQQQDILHGSDFVYSSLDKNAERRHKYFKVCFYFLFFKTFTTTKRK